MIRYATIDIESTGLNRYTNEITYIGVGLAEDVNSPIKQYFIYQAPFVEENLTRLLNLFANLKKRKVKCVWQNGKFDTLFIEHKLGVRLPISHDVMVMGTAYELATEHGLKKMAQKYLGVENWDITKKEKTGFSDKTVQYLKYDVQYTWELFCFFCKKMNRVQWNIYTELLRPAFLMYRDTERNGIYIDQRGLSRVHREFKAKQAEALQKLKARHDINWNSPAQISHALFEVDGLPTLKRSGKTGNPSVDAKVLKRLAAKGYNIATLLLDYKFYYGANTKFLNQWPRYAAYDGRIHPSFGLTNVITGRTSCSDPNLQQVPRLPALRNLFTAVTGRMLIEADYSQIELRVAADYSNDPNMLRVYREGGDIHTETACTLSGTNEPTKEQRSRAKPVNFGFLYGMSARKFIIYAFDSYGVSYTMDEAQRYRDLYFIKYPGLLEWHKEMESVCEALGGVENRFGRFRALPNIYSQDDYERGNAIRRAINTPVQSTASDLLLCSAVEIRRTLAKPFDLKIVGTIHDSILMDVPAEEVEAIIPEVKRIMAKPAIADDFGVSFKIPLEADVSVGCWGKQ